MVENLQSHRANAVINIIAINDVPFNANIINNERHEIKVMPEDKPSNPSIKLIAFVIPTIQPIVITYVRISFIGIAFSKNGIFIFSILIPDTTTITAATICPDNFASGCILFTSSI